MGVIRTDKWLEESFNDRLKIEENILDTVNMREHVLIEVLNRIGLYQPNLKTNKTYQNMKERKAWHRIALYHKKYKKAWDGPDIPIFLFPMASEVFSLFRSPNKHKSGIAFIDKLFLFITEKVKDKELEALFVHEYHHTTRLESLGDQVKYRLADSIIMEGLAEFAVSEYCGESYLAPWITNYQTKEIEELITEKFKPNFNMKRSDPLHDKLLFGHGTMPKMAGYAVGYKLVKDYADLHSMKTRDLIGLSTDKMING